MTIYSNASSIEKQYPIKAEELNMQNYFESLVVKAHSYGLISDNIIEKIQLQSAELLALQTKNYAGCDNSSVKVETAKSILKSIFYCIGVSLKSSKTIESSVEKLKQMLMSQLFNEGKILVKNQLSTSKKLFLAIQDSKIITENYAYNNSVTEPLSNFFSAYDNEYSASDTPVDIDYPLAFVPYELCGIEYIFDYLQRLYFENIFCSYFSSDKIEFLLRGYDEHFEDLLINIFTIVLINALGCSLLNKNALELDITADEIILLQNNLNKQPKTQLHKILNNAALDVFNALAIENKALQNYVFETINIVLPQLYNALQNNSLNKIFISLKYSKNRSLYQFADGAKIDDDKFKKLTNSIRECRFVSDKIALIKTDIHSILDLCDILSAECIFDDEYYEIFASITDIELALLYKQFSSDTELPNEFAEGDKNWHKKLLEYFNKIDTLRKNTITQLATNTDII